MNRNKWTTAVACLRDLHSKFGAWQLFLLAALILFSVQRTCAATDFYVDPDSAPARWALSHPGDPQATRIKEFIADVPMARWFGNWSGDTRKAVEAFVDAADEVHQMPILVTYNIPDRDCGGDSAGGAASASSYRDWINALSRGIGGKKAIVVIEPDSLAQLGCFKTDERRNTRLDLLHYAVSQLRHNAPAADIYLDAGNAHWIAADVMAQRLHAADISDAKGFSLNVSNFYNTDRSLAYANAVNVELGKLFGYRKSVIIDTSRNGNGSIGQWCNPAGSKIGIRTGYVSNDVLLAWIKAPGNSDGACGIAPTIRAGVFSPELANRLIDGR
ncbi:glycoside hydrolase family 6 protein [Rhodanobacter sp. MP1X3]|uniref:glycoside hydrolase family 6 protein n=1 Tax=Rhodanobacter sp. MP1X3 TaxID=2723086 RepID=UPI0021051ADE|nr:glycoside hydrolase family 6 protein [Rhodanobacter sp. MP1X3]